MKPGGAGKAGGTKQPQGWGGWALNLVKKGAQNVGEYAGLMQGATTPRTVKVVKGKVPEGVVKVKNQKIPGKDIKERESKQLAEEDEVYKPLVIKKEYVVDFGNIAKKLGLSGSRKEEIKSKEETREEKPIPETKDLSKKEPEKPRVRSLSELRAELPSKMSKEEKEVLKGIRGLFEETVSEKPVEKKVRRVKQVIIKKPVVKKRSASLRPEVLRDAEINKRNELKERINNLVDAIKNINAGPKAKEIAITAAKKDLEKYYDQVDKFWDKLQIDKNNLIDVKETKRSYEFKIKIKDLGKKLLSFFIDTKALIGYIWQSLQEAFGNKTKE